MRQKIKSIDTKRVIFYKFLRIILYLIDNHSIINRRNTQVIEEKVSRITKKDTGNRGREGFSLKLSWLFYSIF